MTSFYASYILFLLLFLIGHFSFAQSKVTDGKHKLKHTTFNITIIDSSLLAPIDYMITKKTYHPLKNMVLEERDYKFFGLILEECRYYKYDENDLIVEINYFDKTQQLKFTHKYYYNAKGQRYSETSKRKASDIETRTFHLFDDKNRIVATYGELKSGHQYCHDFEYDKDGEQYTTSMSTLRSDKDLFEIFKEDLYRQEAESKPKIKRYGGGSYQDPWSCSLCDGDETTGCLWHDPTECPR